jgi:hypothetical protein
VTAASPIDPIVPLLIGALGASLIALVGGLVDAFSAHPEFVFRRHAPRMRLLLVRATAPWQIGGALP